VGGGVAKGVVNEAVGNTSSCTEAAWSTLTLTFISEITARYWK
jgi:hypothetical protein